MGCGTPRTGTPARIFNAAPGVYVFMMYAWVASVISVALDLVESAVAAAEKSGTVIEIVRSMRGLSTEMSATLVA